MCHNVIFFLSFYDYIALPPQGLVELRTLSLESNFEEYFQGRSQFLLELALLPWYPKVPGMCLIHRQSSGACVLPASLAYIHINCVAWPLARISTNHLPFLTFLFPLFLTYPHLNTYAGIVSWRESMLHTKKVAVKVFSPTITSCAPSP